MKRNFLHNHNVQQYSKLDLPGFSVIICPILALHIVSNLSALTFVAAIKKSPRPTE